MSNRYFHQLYALLVLAHSCLFVGCEADEIPSSPALTPSLIEVEALEPGDRPAAINGAKCVSVCNFMQRDATTLHDKWICVEGVVERAGSRMGAPYIVLRNDLCDQIITLEAFGLDRYHIPLEENIMLRGRITRASVLNETSIVSQSQIDAALEKEAQEEPEQIVEGLGGE